MSRRYFDKNEPECQSKVCFDAQDWMNNLKDVKAKKAIPKPGEKENTSQHTASSTAVSNDTDTFGGRRRSCPLYQDELGRQTWGFLHTMAAHYPHNPSTQQQKDMKEMMIHFGKFYPCKPCAEDFRESIKKTPPDTKNQKTFSLWMCNQHNEVNKKLGKPLFDCTRVDERWLDGWKDGSCD